MIKPIKISPKLEQVLQQLGSVLIFDKDQKPADKKETEENTFQSKSD